MGLRRSAASALALVVLAGAAPADAASAVDAWLVPPVDGTVARPWSAPQSAYGPGHRGIDYAVAEGALVRAAAAGAVSFAGPVAGTTAVTLQHAGGLETTYSSLESVFVRAGDEVAEGQWLGRSNVAHPGGATGLHFGVKRNGEYIDPSTYLGPVGIADAIHLAPTVWRPPDVLTEGFRRAFEDPGTYRAACRDAQPIVTIPPPPNHNVAVAVAGIGSKTKDGVAAGMYEHGPEQLGYPLGSVYRFSYAGARGPLLHEPFDRSDTYGDLRVAADRLRDLLLRVAARAPGRHVDLIAHSQGGVVARLFLESLQRSWDPRLPVIDHLVTFSTPHLGAPLARTIPEFDEDTLVGGLLLDAISAWATHDGPIPDPRSVAAAQLAPGSELLTDLAREDVAFGTRALALGAASDVMVPADRAGLAHERWGGVGWAGVNGHSGILTSPDALGRAYAFLRDAAPTCATQWDRWAPQVGRAASWAESKLPWLLRRGEDVLLDPVVSVSLRALKAARESGGRD